MVATAASIPAVLCSHRYETRALRWSSGEAEPRHVSVMLHVSSFVMAYYPTGKVSEAERHASLILLTCSDWVCLIFFFWLLCLTRHRVKLFLLHLENKSVCWFYFKRWPASQCHSCLTRYTVCRLMWRPSIID